MYLREKEKLHVLYILRAKKNAVIKFTRKFFILNRRMLENLENNKLTDVPNHLLKISKKEQNRVFKNN